MAMRPSLIILLAYLLSMLISVQARSLQQSPFDFVMNLLTGAQQAAAAASNATEQQPDRLDLLDRLIRPSLAKLLPKDIDTDDEPAWTRRPRVEGEFLVKFAPGTSLGRQVALLLKGRASRFKVVAHAQGSDIVVAKRGNNAGSTWKIAKALLLNPEVESIEPNYIYTKQLVAKDPLYTDGWLWGLRGPEQNQPFGANVAAAWGRNYTGARTVAGAVLDEGVQVGHPDLINNIWVNPRDTLAAVRVCGTRTGRCFLSSPNYDDDGNGYINDINGWNFWDRNNRVFDGGRDSETGEWLDAHGTHIAGTMGAACNRQGVVGVNWRTRIISAKFLGPTGGSTEASIAGIRYLIGLRQRGVKIVAINASWGCIGCYSRLLEDAIRDAGNAGILFVAAAGNEETDADEWPVYPGNYDLPNIISVAALDRSGNLAWFSNYGRNTVHLAAPGVGITSTLPNSTYGTYSGTSMAAPFVTGAAMMYAAAYPAATATQIKSAILSSVTPTASCDETTITGGRLNVDAMLDWKPCAGGVYVSLTC